MRLCALPFAAVALLLTAALPARADKPADTPPGCAFASNFAGGRFDCDFAGKQLRGAAPELTISAEARDGQNATGMLKYRSLSCVFSASQLSVLQLALASAGGKLHVGFLRAPQAHCTTVAFSP